MTEYTKIGMAVAGAIVLAAVGAGVMIYKKVKGQKTEEEPVAEIEAEA